MKSLLQELKEHQKTLENQQAQRLAGFSEQLTNLAADQTAMMDAIADIYEQIADLQTQLAAADTATETATETGTAAEEDK